MLGDLEHETRTLIVGFQAFRIAGRLSSNATSTTAPMT
jgi:hypothetical protein